MRMIGKKATNKAMLGLGLCWMIYFRVVVGALLWSGRFKDPRFQPQV